MTDITTSTIARFTAVHRQMRTDTQRVVAAIEVCVPGDRSRRRALARWAEGFASELHLHHTIEDTYFLPPLAARLPDLADVVTGLEQDHAVVDRIMQRWTPAAHRFGDPTEAFWDARCELLGLAIELRDLLARHLDIEDELLVPRFSEAFTEADLQRLEEDVTGALGVKGLAFALPWNIDAHDASERAELIAGAPAMMRVLYRLTVGRHRRLVATAFEGVAVPASSTQGESAAAGGAARHP